MLKKFSKLSKKIIRYYGQTNLKIIKNGGLLPLKDFIVSLELIHHIENVGIDNRNQDLIEYTFGEIILGFILKILAGNKRLFDYRYKDDISYFDLIFSKNKEPHENTYRYFLLKNGYYHRIFSRILFWLFMSQAKRIIEERKINSITIDIDNTARIIYGHQEGAKKGYSANKTYKKLFQATVWYCRELNLLARLELRPGNFHSINNFFKDLKLMINRLKKLGVEILIVADSGYEDQKVMDYLDDRGIKFIFCLKQRKTVKNRGKYAKKKEIFQDTGIQVKERFPNVYTNPYREIYVNVSDECDDNGQYYFKFAAGKFTNIFTTNLDWEAIEVYNHYRKHAIIEKIIEELKNDFALGISHNDLIDYNQFMTQLKGIAFNVKSLYLENLGNIVKEHGYIRLSTMQNEIINIPAVIVNPGNRKIIKFAASGFVRVKSIYKKFRYKEAA